MLAQYPEAGVDRSGLGNCIRSFSVAHYILFYRPGRSGIEFVRILHGRRDITPDLF